MAAAGETRAALALLPCCFSPLRRFLTCRGPSGTCLREGGRRESTWLSAASPSGQAGDAHLHLWWGARPQQFTDCLCPVPRWQHTLWTLGEICSHAFLSCWWSEAGSRESLLNLGQVRPGCRGGAGGGCPTQPAPGISASRLGASDPFFPAPPSLGVRAFHFGLPDLGLQGALVAWIWQARQFRLPCSGMLMLPTSKPHSERT